MKLINADELERKCKAVDDMTVKEFLSLLKHSPEIDAIPKQDVRDMRNEIVDFILEHSANITRVDFYADKIAQIIDTYIGEEDTDG